MPPALDRLLASPSALRLLRAIVNGSEVPAACERSVFCCHSIVTRRQYTQIHQIRTKQKWRRWTEAGEHVAKPDNVQQEPEVKQENPTQHAQHEKTASEKGIRYLNAEKRHAALIDGTSLGKPEDNDAARWAASLARRERYHGLQGTMAIWKLRQYTSSPLPTDNTQYAEYLWGTFIKHTALVPQVIDHAKEVLEQTGQVHPRLYELVMSYWLPRSPAKAHGFHNQMLDKLHLKALPLKKLARYGASTFRPAAYEVLMRIYQASGERDLYDEVVPVLAKQGNLTMARGWHMLCIARGDTPSESLADDRIVQIFTTEAEGGKPVSRESRYRERTYNKDLMRRLLGRDTPPVRFDDVFTARMFATRTFPPDSIIKGLALVGVNEIGPQAVLAMALRTDPLEDLPRMFEELKATGIALQGCVYSLAIEKFAMSHNWQLVRSMLDTDQHPDVFGDADMQRKLLDFYIDEEDHLQAQRSLAILTLFHNDSSEASWNLLLQTHIKRTGPQRVTEVLQDMRTRGVMVNHESVNAIKSLLRRRQRGHRPVTLQRGAYDDLRFVTRIYTTILEFSMGRVSPVAWHEIVRRFGMTGRFKELRRLLLWLVCWYAPRSTMQFADLPSSPFRQRALNKLRMLYHDCDQYFHFPGTVLQHDTQKHPVRKLFPPSLQQALIIWGFRAGLLPNAPIEQALFGSSLAKKHYRRRLLQRQILQRKRWTIGLRTLVLLRNLGVHVHYHTVVKALQMQFIVLFGRGRSRVIENRVVEDVNRIPYSTYVHEVNEIWGSPLLREPKLFHKGMVQDHIWHPRMRRRTDRRASISLNEMFGLGWQDRLTKETQDVKKVPEEDAAYLNLRRRFEAQAMATEPGFEWMYEKSLETEDEGMRGGRMRPQRRVRGGTLREEGEMRGSGRVRVVKARPREG